MFNVYDSGNTLALKPVRGARRCPLETLPRWTRWCQRKLYATGRRSAFRGGETSRLDSGRILVRTGSPTARTSEGVPCQNPPPEAFARE